MAKHTKSNGRQDSDHSRYPGDPKDPKDPNDPKDPKGPNGGEGRPGEPRHHREGLEHRVHQEILERRMRGGPAPSPEKYRAALEQWSRLPGAVVRPPSDVVPDPPDAPDGNGPVGPDDNDDDKGGRS